MSKAVRLLPWPLHYALFHIRFGNKCASRRGFMLIANYPQPLLHYNGGGLSLTLHYAKNPTQKPEPTARWRHILCFVHFVVQVE